MNELRRILADTVEKLFGHMVDRNLLNDAESGIWPQALWQAVEENGLTHVLVPENHGGAGASFADAEVIARATGQHVVPLPICETIIANLFLSRAGLALPGGAITIAPVRAGENITIDGGRVSGVASRVPWGRSVDHVVVVSSQGTIALVGKSAYQVSENSNVAGEPRDRLEFNGDAIANGELPPDINARSLFYMGAMFRSAQIAGALDRILEQSVDYANNRIQFGRPIGKFQAIQQSLADMAGQVAAAGAGATGAFAAADTADAAFEIAVAKTRASEAAGKACSIAHQTHGAIGFTYEHDLHYATRRLWSWRDEFGNDAYWAAYLGRLVEAMEPSALWPFLSSRGANQENLETT